MVYDLSELYQALIVFRYGSSEKKVLESPQAGAQDTL